ncbi:MAG TPA: tail fiber domain-containing protein [Phycisphaerales bacterium]|nr:tail fiber domain-containing protein [Phycisphaerales bacterium]
MRSSLHRVGLATLTALTAAAGAASAQVFTSTGPISIPSVGPASTYPSVINVENLPTRIASISVRLSGIAHSFPGDMDIMLVAPSGQSFILLSDVGGNATVSGVDIVLSDDAPAAPTPMTSGTYACTNLAGGSDAFPGPAPSASLAQATFDSLIGTNPNGTWSLYVVDDLGGGIGSIASWSLEFNESAASPASAIDSALTYQGSLNAGGAPVSGSADFRIRVWSDPTSTAPADALSPVIDVDEVPVNNGLFSLDISTLDITSFNNTMYIELAVRSPAGTGDFVTLNPRQRFAPTAQSLFASTADIARSLAASDGSPVRALTTDTAGRVGVGTPAPRSSLHVLTGSDAALSNVSPNGFLTLGPTSGSNVAFDNNEILARNNGTTAPLYLNADGGSPVVMGTNVALPGISAQIANGLLVQSGPEADFVGITFGPFSNAVGGSIENTDPVGIFRYNAAPDATFLRICAGDVLSAQDGVQIGIRDPGGSFIPQFVFLSSGEAFKPGGGSWSVLSDPRAKHDIAPLTNTLDRLLTLRGYSYEYNADMIAQGIALPGRQMGLMADEVERVFPDWITRDDKGTRFVTERSTTALMVEALRDLRTEKDRELAAKQAEIDNLKARLDRLEAALIAK